MSYLEQALAMQEDCVKRCGESSVGFVYFMQWYTEAPVKIGTASSVPGRMLALNTGHPTPPILLCVVPGGQAQEHWFHRRHAERALQGEWYAPPDPVVDDGREFRALCEQAFESGVDPREARLSAIREKDSQLADLERLYRNGVPMKQIADLTGLGVAELRRRVESMRALGFNLRYRRVYASRSFRKGTSVPPYSGNARLLG